MKLMKRKRGSGFTLIELLIVVAIIGIIAAILIPNLIDALNKAKQKRTMGDMRDVGGSMFSWLTDQIGAAAAGQAAYDFSSLDVLTAAELQSILSPAGGTMFYIQTVPEKDGWGGDYEYGINQSNLLALRAIGIRAPARDGSFESDSYTPGPFLATLYDTDIVWGDGFFVQYPAGASVQ